MHKNSQKRIYLEGFIYFVTFNTYKKLPYFQYDILCRLFLMHIGFCQSFQDFELYAYKINPEHIHLLIKPSQKYNYSQIMGSLKRNFSRDANRLIMTEGDDPDRRLRLNEFHNDINAFIHAHRNEMQKFHLPKFKWQKSFHDHYIRDMHDFANHLTYIENQSKKHNLPENKWLYMKTFQSP